MIRVCLLYRVSISFSQARFGNNLFLLKREVCLSFTRSYTPWKILFYGNDQFSLESLKLLNENRADSSNAKIVGALEVVCSVTAGPVRQYALNSKIPVHDWPYIVPENFYDIGVVVSFGHMIPLKSIRACTFGMLNAHASLLPRWRGASPIAHTILNGDETTGITILQVSPHKFDRGKILLQESFDVPSCATSISLSSFLAPVAARLVLHCLHNLPDLLKNAEPQTEDGVTYASKIIPSMGYVDWVNQTCSDIDQQYRALNGILTLHTEWRGVQAKLIDMIESLNQKPVQLCSNFDSLPGFCYYSKKLKCVCIKCKDFVF